MIVELNFCKNDLIQVRFTTELKNFVVYCVLGKTCLYIVLHDFNLTYYSSIIFGSLACYYSQNYAGILASTLIRNDIYYW